MSGPSVLVPNSFVKYVRYPFPEIERWFFHGLKSAGPASVHLRQLIPACARKNGNTASNTAQIGPRETSVCLFKRYGIFNVFHVRKSSDMYLSPGPPFRSKFVRGKTSCTLFLEFIEPLPWTFSVLSLKSSAGNVRLLIQTVWYFQRLPRSEIVRYVCFSRPNLSAEKTSRNLFLESIEQYLCFPRFDFRGKVALGLVPACPRSCPFDARSALLRSLAPQAGPGAVQLQFVRGTCASAGGVARA